jgi:5'-3' exonuclease
MYIRQLKHEIIEGDDFIAYYCLTKENEKITICTNDTDMAQLINEDVKIYYLHLKIMLIMSIILRTLAIIRAMLFS